MQQQWQWHRDSGRNMIVDGYREQQTAHGTTTYEMPIDTFESK